MSPSSTACAAATWAAPLKKHELRYLTGKFDLPRGYHIDWEGEYESRNARERPAGHQSCR